MKEVHLEYKKLKELYKQHKFKDFIKLILVANASPQHLALGASIGLFLSVFPSFSLGMWLALILAVYLGYNLPATYFGTLIVNPITAPFFYVMSYLTGSLILRTSIIELGNVNILTVIDQVLPQMIIGGIVFGGIVSLLLYLVVWGLALMYQNSKLKKTL